MRHLILKQKNMKKRSIWGKIRLSILLVIFLFVVQQALLDKADLNWKKPLYIAVYPINADENAKTAAYINTLNVHDLEPITAYFDHAAKTYGLSLYHPLNFQLGATVRAIPPAPPNTGKLLDIIYWSLKLGGLNVEVQPRWSIVSPRLKKLP